MFFSSNWFLISFACDFLSIILVIYCNTMVSFFGRSKFSRQSSVELRHEHRSMEAFSAASIGCAKNCWRFASIVAQMVQRRGAFMRSWIPVAAKMRGANILTQLEDFHSRLLRMTAKREQFPFFFCGNEKQLERWKDFMAIEYGIENMKLFLLCYRKNPEIAFNDHQKILCIPFVLYFPLNYLSPIQLPALFFKVNRQILNWHFNIQNSLFCIKL